MREEQRRSDHCCFYQRTKTTQKRPGASALIRADTSVSSRANLSLCFIRTKLAASATGGCRVVMETLRGGCVVTKTAELRVFVVMFGTNIQMQKVVFGG